MYARFFVENYAYDFSILRMKFVSWTSGNSICVCQNILFFAKIADLKNNGIDFFNRSTDIFVVFMPPPAIVA